MKTSKTNLPASVHTRLMNRAHETGDDYQTLQLVTKTKGVLKSQDIIPVRFVPMTGEAQKK